MTCCQLAWSVVRFAKEVICSRAFAGSHIWAISRPTTKNSGAPIHLFAFSPESGNPMNKLFETTAGNWPNTGGNANLVPVVANGLVFVASYQQLQIFRLTGQQSKTNTETK